MRNLTRSLVLASLAAILASCAPGASPDPAAEPETESPVTVLYVFRHAEAIPPPYEDDPPDPRLSEVGLRRAEALTHVLGAEPIDGVFTTGYNRTRDTVTQLAAAMGLDPVEYDPSDLPGFAEELRSMSGRYAISGHSNTTPELVAALGGEPGTPIDHRWEYDRLYVVTIDGRGHVTTILLRFGEPSVPLPPEELP